MESVRVRLQFEDRRMLSKSQRKEGLKRSWIMLKPQHETVSDLAAHILHGFQLQETCHHGLILSMDGFVLPPFESTSVLKDKDVVWVKRRERGSAETLRLCGRKNSVKALKSVEALPVTTNLPLLANEEFIKETGGYESESEEGEDGPSADTKDALNTVIEEAKSKKRKASKKLKSPKRKKNRLANADESPAACGNAGNEEPAAADKKRPQDSTVLLEECHIEKDKSPLSEGKMDIASTSKNGAEVCIPSQSTPKEKAKGSIDASPTPPGEKKSQSRSARRKKLKRQWLSEMRKIGKTEQGQKKQSSGDDEWRKKFLGNNDQTLPLHDDHRKPEECKQQHQSHMVADSGNQQPRPDNSSTNGIVPIEIRPGHIRFEPLDEDADRPVQRTPLPVSSFQWNGVTDKKRGQKWGKEKASGKWADNGYQKTKWTDSSYQKSKWTDDNGQKTSWADGCQKTAWTDNNHQKAACNDSQKLNEPNSQEASGVNETHTSDSTDFTKLSPYGPVPQEGDIVAYRVIELSSSWTPEVSPFRVGKISCCHQGSKKFRLLPVPEHPFDLEKTDKALYGEDGSLEVDFTSLIDVRTFKPDKSESAVAVTDQISKTTAVDSVAVTSSAQNNQNEVGQTPAQANGRENVWEEITQALSAKKEQLSHEDRWKQKKSPASARGPPSSIYRGLRGSALGPLMALLRAQNAMQ